MRVSVVIPTFNGGAKLAALLECLRAQQPSPPDEVVVVDSGSSDDTCKLAAGAGARVVQWDEPYDHGLARDAGISAASGDIVFLTVQDALPASSAWLARGNLPSRMKPPCSQTPTNVPTLSNRSTKKNTKTNSPSHRLAAERKSSLKSVPAGCGHEER